MSRDVARLLAGSLCAVSGRMLNGALLGRRPGN